MKTLQERYEAALTARGFVRVERGRYIVMHKTVDSKREPGTKEDCYFFLGNAGAVRVNNRKRRDTSRAMSDAWKARLIAEV